MKKSMLQDTRRVVKFLRIPFGDTLRWRNREEYRVVYVSSWEVTYVDVNFDVNDKEITSIHLNDGHEIDVAEPIDDVVEKLFGNFNSKIMKKKEVRNA